MATRIDSVESRAPSNRTAPWASELVDSLGEGVAVTDLSGTLVYVNAAFANLAERTVSSLVGTSVLELVGGTDREQLRARLEERTVGRSASYTLAFDRGAGGKVIVRVRATPWVEGGRVRGSIAVVADLTREREIQRRLRRSERRFRQVMERIEEVFWLVNGDASRVIYINEAYETVWGRPRAELRADMESAVVSIVEEDRPKVLDLFARAGKGEEVRDVEYRLRRPDGELRWVSTSAFPVLDAQGEVYRLAGVTQDITKRRRAEQMRRRMENRYHTVIDQAGDGLAVHRADGTIVEVNERLCGWLGRPCTDLEGHSLPEFFEGAPFGPMDQLHDEVLRAGGPRTHEETLATEGGALPVEVRVALLEAASDEPLLISLIRDVSARKEREIDARHAQKLESMGRLASGIAHEINTPIQYVGDSLHFIGDGTDALQALVAEETALLEDPELRRDPTRLVERLRALREKADVDYFARNMPKALERSREGVQRVGDIVQAMRQLAHPGSGERAATDVDAAVRRAATVSRNEYKYHAELELDLALEQPVVCVAADLNQVLLNLIINAADAIRGANGRDGEDPERICIATRAEAGTAVISVRDTGTGIPPEIQDRIFEPFFTTKEVGEGTGQGLALARKVAERHGGTIDFETTPGVGTTFSLRLPFDPDAVVETFP